MIFSQFQQNELEFALLAASTRDSERQEREETKQDGKRKLIRKAVVPPAPEAEEEALGNGQSHTSHKAAGQPEPSAAAEPSTNIQDTAAPNCRPKRGLGLEAAAEAVVEESAKKVRHFPRTVRNPGPVDIMGDSVSSKGLTDRRVSSNLVWSKAGTSSAKPGRLQKSSNKART